MDDRCHPAPPLENPSGSVAGAADPPLPDGPFMDDDESSDLSSCDPKQGSDVPPVLPDNEDDGMSASTATSASETSVQLRPPLTRRQSLPPGSQLPFLQAMEESALQPHGKADPLPPSWVVTVPAGWHCTHGKGGLPTPPTSAADTTPPTAPLFFEPPALPLTILGSRDKVQAEAAMARGAGLATGATTNSPTPEATNRSIRFDGRKLSPGSLKEAQAKDSSYATAPLSLSLPTFPIPVIDTTPRDSFGAPTAVGGFDALPASFQNANRSMPEQRTGSQEVPASNNSLAFGVPSTGADLSQLVVSDSQTATCAPPGSGGLGTTPMDASSVDGRAIVTNASSTPRITEPAVEVEPRRLEYHAPSRESLDCGQSLGLGVVTRHRRALQQCEGTPLRVRTNESAGDDSMDLRTVAKVAGKTRVCPELCGTPKFHEHGEVPKEDRFNEEVARELPIPRNDVLGDTSEKPTQQERNARALALTKRQSQPSSQQESLEDRTFPSAIEGVADTNRCSTGQGAKDPPICSTYQTVLTACCSNGTHLIVERCDCSVPKPTLKTACDAHNTTPTNKCSHHAPSSTENESLRPIHGQTLFSETMSEKSGAKRDVIRGDFADAFTFSAGDSPVGARLSPLLPEPSPFIGDQPTALRRPDTSSLLAMNTYGTRSPPMPEGGALHHTVLSSPLATSQEFTGTSKHNAFKASMASMKRPSPASTHSTLPPDSQASKDRPDLGMPRLDDDTSSEARRFFSQPNRPDVPATPSGAQSALDLGSMRASSIKASPTPSTRSGVRLLIRSERGEEEVVELDPPADSPCPGAETDDDSVLHITTVASNGPSKIHAVVDSSLATGSPAQCDAKRERINPAGATDDVSVFFRIARAGLPQCENSVLMAMCALSFRLLRPVWTRPGNCAGAPPFASKTCCPTLSLRNRRSAGSRPPVVAHLTPPGRPVCCPSASQGPARLPPPPGQPDPQPELGQGLPQGPEQALVVRNLRRRRRRRRHVLTLATVEARPAPSVCVSSASPHRPQPRRRRPHLLRRPLPTMPSRRILPPTRHAVQPPPPPPTT